MKVWPEPAYVRLPAGSEIYHVYRPPRTGTEFNPHANSTHSWRFSPFPGTGGDAVPSWYGALTAEGALYETVFRDVVESGSAAIDRRNTVEGRLLSRLTVQQPLHLVKLFGDGLMRLLLPTSFTTGGPDTYPGTREASHELHDQYGASHGFVWLSRINNEEVSFVVYADRVSESFASLDESYPLDSGRGLALVMKAANRINCAIT